MLRHSLAAVLFATLAAAQQADAPPLPHLLRLGPTPKDATLVMVQRDGALRGADGVALDFDALRAVLARKPEALLLQVDRQTPFAVVDAVLDLCREADLPRVHFAALLPDGALGSFTLALPERGAVMPLLALRLHRERPGVPPDSVRPLLRRVQHGLATAKPPAPAFVLGVYAPGNAPFEQVLQQLAAVASAGVLRIALDGSELAMGAGEPPRGISYELADLAQLHPVAPAKALAIDLQGPFTAQVLPQALPIESPGLAEQPVGCTERAAAGEGLPAGGGAGGRYGGRGGAGAAGGSPTTEALTNGSLWIVRQQQADGSYADAPSPGDIEATALVLLAFLGDGSTLQSGPHQQVLQRGIGWLLAQQQVDGMIGAGGQHPVARHALATYALAEAYGLSGDRALLRGGLVDAIHWLLAQQQPSGGFASGDAGATADTLTTTSCLMALTSAKFFGVDVGVSLKAAASWYDAVGDGSTGAHRLHAEASGEVPATATAASLFARFFLGEDPKEVPIMRQSADLLLLQADVKDPWCAYWTTYALYQMGGRPWTTWSRRLQEGIVQTQSKAPGAEGSWDPPPGGSRLVTTALRALTLEAYYRYTRLVR